MNEPPRCALPTMRLAPTEYGEHLLRVIAAGSRELQSSAPNTARLADALLSELRAAAHVLDLVLGNNETLREAVDVAALANVTLRDMLAAARSSRGAARAAPEDEPALGLDPVVGSS